jgi:tetratricopeptide (TPR) repeat protein
LASSCIWFDDYHIGRRNFKQQDYPYAVIRYERFLERAPKPATGSKGIFAKRMADRREVTMIELGQSYLKMDDYYDAERVFARYQTEFPKGHFIEAARQGSAKVREHYAERQRRLLADAAAAQKDAERIQADLTKKPGDPDLLVALGNAYWKMGQYKSAGESYLKAIEIKPKLKENRLLQERLIFDMNGNLVPIVSPQQRVALENEREPLVIEDVHDYTSRGTEDFVSSRRIYYMVTGTVRNRSTRPILGARVEVTFYNALDKILEVGTASIGTLYPQESRPFVVKAGLDAEAMGNITRYRCQPLFQQ